MKRASLLVKNVPSNPSVRLYFREAGRSYVFGHWLSSIALARAAPGADLRECIESAGFTPDRVLKAMIGAAGKLKLLDARTHALAGEAQRNGNAVIHATSKAQTNQKVSFDTLVALRGVLLYPCKDAEG
jgi:hypothetical protein